MPASETLTVGSWYIERIVVWFDCGMVAERFDESKSVTLRAIGDIAGCDLLVL